MKRPTGLPAVYTRKPAQARTLSYATLVCFTVLNLTLLLVTSYLWYRGRSQLAAGLALPTGGGANTDPSLEPQAAISLPSTVLPYLSTPAVQVDPGASTASAQPPTECTDPLWCQVPIPTKSHYNFDTPIDPARWRIAQIQASRGEQVLLDRVIRVFPNSFDFLDGDRSFRRLHSLMDIFVDHKTGLSALLKPGPPGKKKGGKGRRLAALEAAEGADDAEEPEPAPAPAAEKEAGPPPLKGVKGEAVIAGHVDGKRVVPEPYNFRVARRAPILQMGYFGFSKNLNTFFSGDFVGGNFIKKQDFFFEWSRVKQNIDVPFITVCALNENWGLLSTMFPNRTAAWGQCCEPAKERLLYEFLDHPKTLMLITNQHHNMSHPKLLTIPRGIPLTWQFTAKLMWDAQRHALHNIKKTKLLFAASSNWGARGQMIRCISSKFDVADFEGHALAPTIQKTRSLIKLDRRHYYEKLSGTLFGLALPGLGYDCFRTWELLTMGTIVVLERGVGLDRTSF